MAINFPNNPNLNDTHTVGTSVWRWNGYAWVRLPDPGDKGEKGEKGEKGDKGTTGDKGQKGDDGEKGVKGEDNSTKGEKGDAGVTSVDKITEGNTEAEVVDDSVNGHFKVTTEGNERFRINAAGEATFSGDKISLTGTDSYLNIGSNANRLELRNNGTSSYLYHYGTSTYHIALAGSGTKIQLDSVSEVFAEFKKNAECSLYYDNTKRFETTDDGVKITGGLQDEDGHVGAAGSILSSTGTALDWIPAASIAITDKIIEGNTKAEVVDTGSNGHFLVETEGTERFRINSLGNLQAAGITSSYSGFMFGSSTFGGEDGEMYLYKSAANTASLRITSDGPFVEFKDVSGDVQMGSASGTLLLSAGGNEKLRIGSSGQIGLSGANYGSSGQVLTSNGSSSAATWETPSSGSTTLNSDAQENTVGGTDAGLNLDTDTFRNTLFGYQAGEQINSGDDNTFIGHMAGDACNSGYKNVGVGAEVLPNLTSGYRNVAIGWEAGRSMSSGYDNTAIGDMAGRTFTSAVECIAIGAHAASNFGSGTRVIGIGAESVWLGGTDVIGIGKFTMARGGSQVGGIGIGYYAGRNNKGDHNIYLGYQSGFGKNTSPYSLGNYNIALGHKSLYNVDTSSENIAIGSSTANTLTTGTNNIIIGSGVDVPSASTSNQIILGNSNITKFSIPGINVILKDNNGTPTQGHVLTVDSNGEASFESLSGNSSLGTSDKIEEGNTKAEVVDTGTSGRFIVETEGTERLRIDSTGSASFTGNVDVDGLAELDDVNVTGISTFKDDVEFHGSGTYNDQVAVFFDKSINHLRFKDDVELSFGDEGATTGHGDLRIFHDGNESKIWDNGTGGLVLQTASSPIELRALQVPTDEIMLKATPNGAVDLYHDDTLRFSTTNNGVRIYGGLQDEDGHVGAAGSILSSTGTALDWIPASETTAGNANEVNITDDTTKLGTHYIHFGSETSGYDGVEVDSTGLVYTDGNVGIGGTIPSALLQIYTTASQDAWKFRIDTDVSDGAGFYQRANGDFEMVLRDASNNVNHIMGTDGALTFTTTGTEKVRITSTGNVGIGTTNPDVKLHVMSGSGSGYSGSFNARTAAVFEDDNTDGTTISILGKSSGYSGIFFGDESNEALGQIQYRHSDESFTFLTNYANPNRNALFISGDNNVGIGTSVFDTPVLSSNTSKLAVGIVTANEYYGVFKGTIDSNVTISSDKISEGNTSAEVIDAGSDGRFIVTTEGTERFSINASGEATFSRAVGISSNLNVTGFSTFTDDVFTGIGATVGISTDVFFPSGAEVKFNNNKLRIYNWNSYSRFTSTDTILMGAYGTSTSVYLYGTNTNTLMSNNNRLITAGGTEILETDGTTAYLKYSGNEKLRTTGYGVTITGKTFIADTGGDVLTLESTVNTSRTTIKFNTDGNDWEIGSRGSLGDPNNSFYIYDNAALDYRFAINPSGNVGIGTVNADDPVLSSNTAKLAVGIVTANEYYGEFKGTIDSNVTISSDKISEGDTSAEVVDTGSDGHFKVITEGTEKLRVTGIGSVSIGTNSPDSALDVVSQSPIGINAHLGGSYTDNGQIAVRRIEFGTINYRNAIQSQQGSGGHNFSTNDLLLNPSGGSVGIGTTLPSSKLDVQGDILYNNNAIIANIAGPSDGGTNNIDHIWHQDDNLFGYGTGGLWNFVADSTYKAVGNSAIQIGYLASSGGGHLLGNVGIGTTVPTDPVLASNNSKLAVGIVTANEYYGVFKGTIDVNVPISNDKISEGNTSAEVVDTGSNGHFKVITEGDERLRITEDGRVGIGTTIPDAILDVFGDIKLSDTNPEIQLNTGGPRFRVPSDNTLTIHSGGDSGSESLERLRITSNGNVGIGTTNPKNRLHVSRGSSGFDYNSVGDLIVEDDIGATIQLLSPSTHSNQIHFGDETNGMTGRIQYNHANHKLSLWTQNNERVTLHGKNVGIGTTIPDDPVLSTNTNKLAVGIVTCHELYVDGLNVGGAGAGSTASSVPVGSIVAWAGLASQIDTSEWQLCDGGTPVTNQLQTLLGAGNNVPDLKNKFIVGAKPDGNTTYPGLSVGATGGSANATLVSHSHTINNHTHSFSETTGSDSHTHSYSSANYPTSSGTEQNQSGGPEDRTTFNVSKTTGSDSHSHSVSGTTGNPSNTGTNSQGSSATNANLPPYYALCYIIKHTASSGDVGVSRVAILKDEKGNQASGGTFYSGGWRDRDLTVEEDPSNFVDFTAGGSQSSGSVGNTPGYWSLPAGDYKIDWTAPAFSVSRHKSRLVYSTTQSHISTAGLNASASFVEGTSVHTGTANASTDSTGHTIINLTQTTWFKVMHYCSTTESGAGFGRKQSSNPGNESVTGDNIYTQVRIEDLATVTKSGVTIGDKIEEGNTKAEVIDTGSDGKFVITTEGVERVIVDPNGYLNTRADIRLRRTASNDGGIYFGDSNNNYIFGADSVEVLTFATGGTGDFVIGETVTGGTSNVTAIVKSWNSSTRELGIYNKTGNFNLPPSAETVTGASASWTTSSFSTSEEDVLTFATAGSEKLRIKPTSNTYANCDDIILNNGGGVATTNNVTGVINMGSSYYHDGTGNDLGNGSGHWSAVKLHLWKNNTATTNSQTINNIYGLGVSNGMMEIQTDANLGFFVGNDGTESGSRLERMRINTAGLLSIGSAGALINESGLGVRSGGNTCVLKSEGATSHNPLICWNSFTSGTTRNLIQFGAGPTYSSSGSITTNGNSTAYGSSSDYRMKQDEVLITDGIEKVKSLKPRRFKWKDNLDLGMCDGFFAHEIEDATPTSQATIGTKDAVATESDVNVGLATSIGDPIYQQVDQTKLIPVLTAALKEAIAKIETLEAKVAALEGS